ncbi:MAG: hypothetical protein WCZ98_01480 [Sideroxydans sp.]
MALNRLVAHLEDSTIAAVAEHAAVTGTSFDHALAQIIAKGVSPTVTDTLSDSVGQLLEAVAGIHGNAELDAAVGAVWCSLRDSWFEVAEVSEGGAV